MTARRVTHTLWFIGRPSDDVPGDWEAHCLEFDLVAQGEKLLEALELAIEAAGIHIRESLRDQRNPYSARAPKKFWELRSSIIEAGEMLSADQFHELVHNGGDWLLRAELPVGVDGQPGLEPKSTLVWKRAA
jgi:hypothetical protein